MTSYQQSKLYFSIHKTNYDQIDQLNDEIKQQNNSVDIKHTILKDNKLRYNAKHIIP